MKRQDVLRYDQSCRLCLSDRVITVLQLTPTPLEDQFVAEVKRAQVQPVYPLDLAICESCGYVYLPYVVSPDASYEDYAYVSSVTVGLRGHYDEYANDVARDFAVLPNSLAVDLGSNDGSMLASFKRLGFRALGVEPAARIAKQANRAGLSTINDFFTAEVVSRIVTDHGLAGIVSANYMYANIDDVVGFTKAVSSLLAPDGIFVVQTGYHPEQMKIRMFDYIYHEHFSYFSVDVLKGLFEKCGLELIHVQKISPKGGSVRVVGQLRNGIRPIDGSVQRFIEDERRQGIRDPETYRRFAQEIAECKSELLDLLNALKTNGKRIVGFGASHSTTTLIYHFGLESFLEYLVDDNALKHGRFSPGHHIPVFPSGRLLEDRPDYVLVLGWQHQRSIMNRHRSYASQGGRWIVPLPSLQVL